MPRKQRSNIAALEKVKEKYPEMAEVVDARIPVIQERIKSWADPAARRDEAMVRKRPQIYGMYPMGNTISHCRVPTSFQGPMNSALDTLEKKLEECGGPFLCGGEYTLADCLFTCVLARLGMISMLGETFKTRQVAIGLIS